MHHRRDTSAGMVVFHRDGRTCRFLLLLSRLTKRPLWEFPKGGVDPGETALQAALRELQEETGLGEADVRLAPGFQEAERYRFTVEDGKRPTTVHKRVVYFLAEALHTRVQLSAAEVQDCAWLDFDEAYRRVRYRERRRILTDAARAAGCLPDSAVGNDVP